MAAFQRDLFPYEGYGETSTLESSRLALWRVRNASNSQFTCARVTHLVATMQERIRVMAPKGTVDVTNGHFQFVNVAVSDDDIEKVEELFPTPDVAFNLLTGVLTEGLKVSFSLNSANDLTICSLYDKREKSPTHGHCLTGGADGWYDALCVVLYKYTALLHGDLANGDAGTGSRRRIV